VAIVGDPDAADTQALLDELRTNFHPRTVVAFAPPERVADDAARIPLLESRQAVGGRPTAYVCRGQTCRLPVHSPDDLRAQLAEG
jgi:hypothetical protein